VKNNEEKKLREIKSKYWHIAGVRKYNFWRRGWGIWFPER
jgi:hypothetical protein